MITDALIGVVLGIYEALVGLLPEMPARPEAFERILNLFQATLFILPVDDLRAFAPAFFATLGLLIVVRVVRLFLPGGGG